MPTCSLVLTLACFLYGFTFSGRGVQAASHKEQCLYFIAFVEFLKDIFHITVCIHTLFLLPTSIPFHGITFYIPSCQLEDIWRGLLPFHWYESTLLGTTMCSLLKGYTFSRCLCRCLEQQSLGHIESFPLIFSKISPTPFPGIGSHYYPIRNTKVDQFIYIPRSAVPLNSYLYQLWMQPQGWHCPEWAGLSLIDN